MLVNVGRGVSVDTKAPVAELNSGRPPGSTHGAWQRAWAVTLRQIEANARGERPPNLVAGSGVESGAAS